VPTVETTNEQLRRKAVLDWLPANPRWLLILDNVDTRTAMSEAPCLLRDLTGGHVLITTRLANFPTRVEPLELDVFSADAAVDFLLNRTKGPAAFDSGRPCPGTPGGGRTRPARPCARAGGDVRGELTFGQYLQQWQRSNRDEVLTWSDATVTGYPNSIAATWKTSVGQLSEPARRLLERLAWLAPGKTPESLLDTPIPGAKGENLTDALDDLSAFSLVVRDAEGPYFLVHRLVQDVTRRSLSGDERRRGLQLSRY
jgi:hypothetical protein